MTHVGLICDNRSLHGHLPHVLIANDRTILHRDVRMVEANLPPNVYLFHGKSSWNNTELMVRIIALIGSAVRRNAPGSHVIISMDAV